LLKGAIPLILVFAFSACATNSQPSYSASHSGTAFNGDPLDFKIDTLAPLGRIDGSGSDPDAFGVAECGLALEVKRKASIIEIDAKMNNLVFPASSGKIVWFARFGMKGMLQQQIPRSFKIEWYDPGSHLYAHSEFKSSFWAEDLIQSDLVLPATVPPEMIGRWRVRVWCKGKLLDDRYFNLM